MSRTMRPQSDKTSANVKSLQPDNLPGENSSPPGQSSAPMMEEDVIRGFGRRARLIRYAAGFSGRGGIEKFAEHLGLGRDIIEKMETERTVTARQAVQIKKMTGFATDYLLAGDTAGLNSDQLRRLAAAERKLSAEARSAQKRAGRSQQR